MNGKLAIGGEGDGAEDALEIQLPVARAGAVAVAQQIIEAIAIELAAHEGLDDATLRSTVFKKVCHGLRSAR